MYDSGKIIAGLVVFLLVATFPYLMGVGKSYPKPDPKVDTPYIQQLAEKKCVESKAVMKTEHMQMLNDWRDASVRDGLRVYTASDGKQYPMSLQNTCMKCHSNKKNFCDQCHNYTSVKPYCWDCHIEPKEGQAAEMVPAQSPASVSAALPTAAKLYFAVGKAALSSDAKAVLIPMIDYLKAHPQAAVDISGFVDKTGNPAKNADLAKNRAKAVRDLLISAGIATERINMKKPEVITGGGSDADARRVEVSIAGGKGV